MYLQIWRIRKSDEGVFNVYAENQIVAENIDVISEVGRNTFYQIDTEVQVSDGILDIYFEEELDSAFINVIIVDRIPTSIENKSENKSLDKFNLYQNYPNPFNGTTHLRYYLPNSTDVSVKIYDIIGNEILYEKIISQSDGEHRHCWSGVDNFGQAVNSGVYIYQLSGNGFALSKKMILLK